MSDRYFDQIGAHFAHKIYASPKGAIRLAVLTHDLQQWLPGLIQAQQPLRILDVGAGLGHLSAWLAGHGHQLTVIEPSAEMLEAARERIDAVSPKYPASYRQVPLQALADSGERYDLVICHAVLEWLADPAAALAHLRALLQPRGSLSLAFYNRDALVYKNLIKGQFDKLKRNQLAGQGKRSLTPQQPLDPREMARWAADAGLKTRASSGVRVFYDYMPEPFRSAATLDQLIEQEVLYSGHPAYRHLGRYLHWWLQPDA